MSLSADLTLAGTRSGQPSAHHGPAVWTSSTGVYSSLQLQSCSTMSPLLAPSCPSPAQPRAAKGSDFVLQHSSSFPARRVPHSHHPPALLGTPSREPRVPQPLTHPRAKLDVTSPVPSLSHSKASGRWDGSLPQPLQHWRGLFLAVLEMYLIPTRLSGTLALSIVKAEPQPAKDWLTIISQQLLKYHPSICCANSYDQIQFHFTCSEQTLTANKAFGEVTSGIPNE